MHLVDDIFRGAGPCGNSHMLLPNEPFLIQLVKRFDVVCLNAFLCANMYQLFRVGRIKPANDDH